MGEPDQRLVRLIENAIANAYDISPVVHPSTIAAALSEHVVLRTDLEQEGVLLDGAEDGPFRHRQWYPQKFVDNAASRFTRPIVPVFRILEGDAT